MTNKRLEEIFLKDGKFVNRNKEKINPYSIGKPIIINGLRRKNKRYWINSQLSRLKEEDKAYKKVNSYLIGETIEDSLCNGPIWSNTPIQFYKI